MASFFVGGKKTGLSLVTCARFRWRNPAPAVSAVAVEAYCSAAATRSREEEKQQLWHHESGNVPARAEKSPRSTPKLDGLRAGGRLRCFLSIFIKKYTDYLGLRPCTDNALFDPEIIAFGGAVSNDVDFMLSPIREYASNYAFFKNPRKNRYGSRNAKRRGIVGAAMLYFQR
jgi:hypothetical protein